MEDPHETNGNIYNSLKCYSFFYRVLIKIMCLIEFNLSFEGVHLFLDPT